MLSPDPDHRLFPFQIRDVQKAVQQHTLITSECGIGKTVEAVAVVVTRRRESNIGPTLVLCNNSAKEQWADFVRDWDPGVPVVVVGKAGRWPEGEVELRHWFHPRHNVWVIAHHEALSLPKSAKALAKRKYNAPKVWGSFVWENIIVDECHRYKGRKASRRTWLKTIDGLYRLGMTGTAIERDPADVWSVLNWLYPKEFPSYWKFRDEWCELEKQWGGHTRSVGVKQGRERQFAELLGPFTIHRSKRDPDVMPDLPPKVEQTIPLVLEPGTRQYKLYAEIGRSKDLEVRLPPSLDLGVKDADWHLIIPNVLAQIVRLQQVLSDPRLLGIPAGSVKLDWVRDYVADNPDESIVVFTRFRDVALTLAEDLGGAIAIGGRIEGLVAWQAGEVRVLCGTIAKMGESLNLQAARTAIFVDHEYSTIKMQQAYDRVDRIDITESKHIMHLVVKNTVDGLVMEALREKWSQQELVYHYLKEAQGELGTVVRQPD